MMEAVAIGFAVPVVLLIIALAWFEGVSRRRTGPPPQKQIGPPQDLTSPGRADKQRRSAMASSVAWWRTYRGEG